DHNFLKLVPGNGGVTVTFPFAPATTAPPPPDLLQIAGNSLTYLRPMANKERISFPVSGFGPTAKDYDFTISGAGASVRVQGDQPITRMNIFSIDRVQSVEPYIAIDLAPGAEKIWTYTYTFACLRRLLPRRPESGSASHKSGNPPLPPAPFPSAWSRS